MRPTPPAGDAVARRSPSRIARHSHPTQGSAAELLLYLALGLLCAWGAALLEFSVAALAQRAEFSSRWELQHGLVGALPSWLLAAAPAGLLGGVTLASVQRPSRRLRWALALCWAVFGLLWGYGVGGGRHLASLPLRAGFAALVALTTGAAAWLKQPWLVRGLDRARGRTGPSVGLGALVLLGAAGVWVVNQTLLVRLYPAFHLGLTTLFWSMAVLLVAPWLPRATLERGVTTPRVALGVVGGAAFALALAALALLPASRSIAGFDNFRLICLESGPNLQWGVRLASVAAPPPELRCTDDTCGQQASSGPSRLDWTGRDIVLITVDALRADHVGAYGYTRPTTPQLDALAREGAVFEHAYAATPHTSYSLTSLMTGKYMRPLLLQGAGEDSDTWAGLLRRYGYRTAAFYPPAVFFIDRARFERFEGSHLDFEYQKVEFAEGDKRIAQVKRYLEQPSAHDQPRLLWLHLFGPHEPYEAHAAHPFGARDVDRYDAEIADADRTLGEVVAAVRQQRPSAVVIVTADHGEEFGDHGGRYHGTTVYEEQIRVPLILSAPGSVTPQRVQRPVQTIDLLPTVLGALQVPRPARMRGRDLGPLLAPQGAPPDDLGLAVAETEEQSLLAEGTLRLLCERKLGACRLYDLATDPGQRDDVAASRPDDLERLRQRSRELAASHGELEARGLRAEGKRWPAAVVRGLTGDVDAAAELAELLDDADVTIRRKAAELLFELRQESSAPSLRLALARDEDAEVRRWAALALTRLGQGAPLVYELAEGPDRTFRRLAALALAETGDARGEDVLVAWWRDTAARDFERSRQLLAALANIRAKEAVWPLVQSLGDVRLRPEIARTLAAIGDEDARGSLLVALRNERYQGARVALVDAVLALDGRKELAPTLVRFLGVPDPLPGGLLRAERAGVLDRIGGPKERALAELRRLASSGVKVDLVVPAGGNKSGVRLLFRAAVQGSAPGHIYVQKATPDFRKPSKDEGLRIRNLPTIDRDKALDVIIPASDAPSEVAVTLPQSWGAKAGHALSLALFSDRSVQLETLAAVPLADELPPPAPRPWKAGAPPAAGEGEGQGAPDGPADEPVHDTANQQD